MKRRWMKRTIALAMSAVMTTAMPISSMASTGPVATTEAGKAKEALALEMERESIVLAQNNDDILPLDAEKQVAVFGRGQIAPSTGGSGSGAVNGSYTSNFLDGLDKLGVTAYAPLRAFYEEKVQGTTINHGWDQSSEHVGEWGTPVYSGTGFSMTAGVNTPDVKLDDGEIKGDGIVAQAAEACDTAVVFITRTTGSEEMDRIKQPGDWYLDPSEKTLLQQVTDKFDNVVAILSVNGSIDMSWVETYGVDAVMISYGSGSQTGYAMAEIAYGVTNPSAKLADTITKTYEEHPTAENFGYTSYAMKGYDASNAVFGSQDPISVYAEGIYEGYRYFDTFGKEVLYPFGSGLSYSDFSFTDMDVNLDEESKSVTVTAKITNTTEDASVVEGKEVMEVYVSVPEGKLEQPYQKLVDYEKTEALSKGESQTVEIQIPIKDLASYDEDQAAYILEPGSYYFRVGSSSRDTHIAGAISIESEILTEQLTNELSMAEEHVEDYEAEALSNEGATPITYDGEQQEMAAAAESAEVVDASDVECSTVAPVAEEIKVEELPENAPVYKFSAVQDGTITLKQFVSQLSQDELLMLGSGGATAGIETYYRDDAAIRIDNISSKTNQATSGAGSSRSVERLNIPSVTYADGSAGISYDTTESVVDKNTGWSRAAAVACIWNKDLVERFGVAMGQDMLDINVDIWLAPSINLHRNPLNGRNNEYYSEDPILSGLTAAAAAMGVNSKGVTVCLKHYAGNDQEYYRRGLQNETTLEDGTSLDAINVIISERALRELILKPFEIAVETRAVYNVMAAFNKVNGQYAATSQDMLIDILHGEWGYEGFVVTDWGDLDTIADPDAEMAGGINTIMSGKHVMYRIPDKIEEGLEKGTVTIEQLQRNAYYLLNGVLSSALTSDASKNTYTQELSIKTSSLPVARVNREYSETKVNPIIAVGGEGNTNTITLSNNSKDSIPQGLTLLPNGSIKGEPEEGTQGTYELTFAVTDASGNTADKTLEMKVEGELIITPEELPVARYGQEYSAQLKAFDKDGKETAATFSTTDTLPAGLTLSSDGLISGTSQEKVKDFSLSIQVESGAKNGAGSFTLHCIEKDVEITTESLTKAELNANYEYKLTTEGGLAPYTYKVKNLPTGFTFQGDTIKSGNLLFGLFFVPGTVPESAEGNYEITIIVTDALGGTHTKTVPLQVGNPAEDGKLVISTGSLPMGRANETYETTQFTVNNATGNVVYSLAAGSDELPNGLTLSESGELKGTAASDASGLYHLIISATDDAATVTKAMELYIQGRLNSDPVAFTTFQAETGETFSQEVKALDGPFSTDYTYKLDTEKGDALPAGLTLTVKDYVGTISGTPQAGTEGTYELLIIMDTAVMAGNPVTTVIPYTLVVTDKEQPVDPDEPIVDPDKPIVDPDKPIVEPDKPIVEPDKPSVEPDKPDTSVQAEKVTLNEKKLVLGVKESYQLKAEVEPANAAQTVTWKSSNKNVVKVTKDGKVTAVKKGTAKIQAVTANGKSVTCTVTVKKAPKKITLNRTAVTLKKNKTFKIKVKLPKNTASKKIIYKSSKKAVAAVSTSGKITAKKKGTAIITVRTFNGKKAKIKVRVK